MTRLDPLFRHLLLSVVIVACFALLPLVLTQRYFLGEVIVFFLWAMVALNWNLLMGHAGVFSLAQMLFFATGAYAVAMSTSYMDLSIWAAIPLGALVAALAAFFIGLACLRLTGAYVALLTFAIVGMVHVLIITETECFAIVRNSCQQLFGGAPGFSQFTDFGFRPMLRGNWILGNYYAALTAFALCLVVVVVVIHGRLGLAFRAIRDNVGYASSRGINRRKYQIAAFCISALMTGLAGAIYAAHFRAAGPSLFDFSTLLFVLSMVVVGGVGSTWGPLVGAGTMMLIIEFSKSMGDARNLILGVSLVIFVVALPKGLAGLWARLRGSRRRPLSEPEPQS
ncbi:MAG: branched-chain amino acid ABC transporter permease [Paracoccaceae bacterium]